MAFNFQQLAMMQRIKPLLEKFQTEHPKFIQFFGVIQHKAIQKDSVLELTVTSPDGNTYTTNIRLTDNDMELMGILKGMKEPQ